jgi:LysR family transcriptional activator of nhaA
LDQLNFHHLHLFWVVAREGGVTAAARRLRLAPSTVSVQIRDLETQLGSPLLARAGRNVELTDAGKTVYRYAERIFALGLELRDTVLGEAARPTSLTVGVADAIPKLMACQLLEPALTADPPFQLVVREGRPDRLVAELVLDELDLVLADAPVAIPRVFDHLLGASAVSFFAVPRLAAELRDGFPGSLASAPLLLPLAGSPLRRALDRWFESLGVAPRAVAEFEDGALLNVFGQRGAGAFASLSVVENVLAAERGVELIGRVESMRVPYYAVTAHPEFRHPAVAAIVASARQRLASGEASAALPPSG